ncbi:hypothetical protein [Kordia sp.]|uniref:hypothetical protein n=1 Tax=Kordia sp. TaxID=1965332 RepID=UPI003D2CF678
MSNEIHKNLDKLLNDELIDKDVKKVHQDISAKVEKQKRKLSNEINKRKSSNNDDFNELPKGLIIQLGNFEIQT